MKNMHTVEGIIKIRYPHYPPWKWKNMSGGFENKEEVVDVVYSGYNQNVFWLQGIRV